MLFEDAPITLTSVEGFTVVVEQQTLSVILNSCIKAGRRETGGILIGKYDSAGWRATVVEATPKPRGSSAGWFWFRRGNAGLRDLLQDRWQNGLHYIGEWHFHPGGSPEPSVSDFKAMKKIALNENFQCKEPLLVILGGDPKGNWELSATIVRPPQNSVRLMLGKP